MESPADLDAPLLVACLCAAWCGTCRDYRAVFDALERRFGAQALCLWVDIEDEEDTLGDVDVVDFPTLLIAREDTVLFFGPVTPHPQTAQRLVDSARLGELAELRCAELIGLPARLRQRALQIRR